MPRPSGRFVRWLIVSGILCGLLAAAVWYRERWQAWFQPAVATADDHADEEPPDKRHVLELSPQARKNLGLVSRPVKLQTYWRTILVPGEIVDRPGVSDRGVTSPAVGVVTQIYAFPGDTVHPGDKLFTLRLISEYVQSSQAELFRATHEIELIREERERLAKVAKGGGIPQSRILELDRDIRRQQAAIQGYRQDLLTRGFAPPQIDEVSEGRFVSSIDVVAPPALPAARAAEESGAQPSGGQEPQSLAYEMQELKVDLGTQVQAGQLLSVLANHQALYVTGHAFKREAPYLEKAAEQGWPIRIEFAEDDAAHWPALDQKFEIRHLANSVERTSRTFDFFVPISNQSRSYEKEGREFIVWRFRPGQRVRLHVPVEELKDVFVLPAGAVVREGPEAYVFRQNGDLFDRRPVWVKHADRLHVVVANDGSVSPGWYLAQSGAASLNRVLKAQAASGTPAGVHVHADGSVHGAH
jgi:multidrug efflux pump subunit AcrA (membrane-fusion protein)